MLQDVVCLCIHRVVQNTKQHWSPFPIHDGSVYTICVLFLVIFLIISLIYQWRSITVPGTKSGSFSLINVGSGFSLPA
jgi:hypothetical protein